MTPTEKCNDCQGLIILRQQFADFIERTREREIEARKREEKKDDEWHKMMDDISEIRGTLQQINGGKRVLIWISGIFGVIFVKSLWPFLNR